MTSCRLSTPIGTLHLVLDASDQLVSIDVLPFDESVRSEPVPASATCTALERYFAGHLGALDDVAVAPSVGTAFQREVWRALRGIPCGETISYAALAERVGRPSAYRAVGSANGANPIPIVVPCHRVVNASGALGGYAYGLDIKRWLLEHEGALVPAEIRVRRR